MKSAKLNDMIRGWFVGNFEPTLYRTNDVEVAVKEYTAGEFEDAHYHKIATEISVVLDGSIRRRRKTFRGGYGLQLRGGLDSLRLDGRDLHVNRRLSGGRVDGHLLRDNDDDRNRPVAQLRAQSGRRLRKHHDDA